VETARNLGAKYVVSGTVVESASRWDCTVKIHMTSTAALLQSERVSGPDYSALLDMLRPKVRRLASAAIQVPSTAVQVGPVTETGQAEVHTGASVDFAALAARAAQAKANREHKEKAIDAEQARLDAKRARLAEEERRTKAALRAAQQKRLDKETAKLKAQASADFAAIEPLVTMQVTSETRPVLQAYLDKWSDASVKVDDLARKVSVPELVAVRRAMSSSAARSAKSAPQSPPTRKPSPERLPSRPAARSPDPVVTAAVLSIVGGSMLAGAAMERNRIRSELQAGTLSLSSAESDASTVNRVVIAGYCALAGAAVWVGIGMRNTAAGPTLSLGGRW
jgi:DNA polymerase III gamma/tau subunit